MKNTMLLICAGFFLMLVNGGAFGQSCPNWSPKFDEITNPDVRAQLQQMNWDGTIAQNGGPEATIALFKSTLEDAQSHRDNAAQIVQDVAADPEAARLDATWDDCRPPANALMAAKCEYLNMTELILTAEGSIELAQCRQ
jgi:hypothetical protein